MLKLQQDQVWKVGAEYLRIVGLERLSVTFKRQTNLTSRDGTHATMSKKEFCRLIKPGTLLSADEVRAARADVL